jgi:hypothetical protein
MNEVPSPGNNLPIIQNLNSIPYLLMIIIHVEFINILFIF